MMYTEFGKYADPLEKIQQAKSKTIFFYKLCFIKKSKKRINEGITKKKKLKGLLDTFVKFFKKILLVYSV